MYKPVTFHILLMLLLFSFGLSGCANRNNTTGAEAEKTSAAVVYTLPDIPVMLTTPEERANYLVEHYWSTIDFSDTMIVHQPKVIEQAFVDYIDLFPQVSKEITDRSIQTTLQSCSQDSIVRNYFTKLFDKYLNDPNSAMRNEELYIIVLENIIASDKFPEIEKVRPQFQLKNALKNRVGDVAADFTYTQPSGKSGRMHQISAEYLLIYFYNPDCHACKEVQQTIESSPGLTKLQSANRMRILAMYIDKDTELWKKYAPNLPSKWINGQNIQLREDDKYSLRAIPTLYLLDKNKKVLLKDVTLPQIDDYLGFR